MATTKISTRLQLKFDTWTNWNSLDNTTSEKTFIPLKGEICIVEIPINTDTANEEQSYLLKVGNGVTTFKELPWVHALAADVHAWGKLNEYDFKAYLTGTKEIEGLTSPQLVTQEALSALQTQLTGHISDKANPHEVTKAQVGLGSVTNNRQIVGLSSGTTKDHIVTWGANGYTVADGNKTITELVTAIEEAQGQANKGVENAGAAQTRADKGVADAKIANDAIAAMSHSMTALTGAKVISQITQTNGKITSVATRTLTLADIGASAATDVTNLTNRVTEAEKEIDSLQTSVANINTKISNAMHFLGSTTTAISDGSSTATISINGTNETLDADDAGAVVLYGGYEYVWIGTAWEQLGQEGSFAVKGSIANSDIKSGADIDPSKIGDSGVINGNTTLKADITSLNTKIADEKTAREGIKSFSTVTVGSTSVVAESANDTLTVAAGTDITVAGDATNDKVTIGHKVYSGASTVTGVDNTKLNHEDTFKAITGLTISNGHIDGIKTTTYTLPDVEDLQTQITNIKSYSKIAGDTGTADAEDKNEGITFVGGTAISTAVADKATGVNDTVTINHEDVTRATDTTSSGGTLAHAGTFTVVDSIASNAQGHITAVTKKTYTLPDVSSLTTDVNNLKATVWTSTSPASYVGATPDAAKIMPLKIGAQTIDYLIFDCGGAPTV